MTDEFFEGGCLCGAVRYRVEGAPSTPHWCHCGMCRKATGAPVAAWANFLVAGFTFIGSSEPTWFRSSKHTRRGFCGNCGGSLCTLEDGDQMISILIGSLDDPSRIAPHYHIHTANQVAWLDIDDGLPRR